MNTGGFSARRADFLCLSVKCSNVQSLTLTKPVARRASLTLPGDKSISHRAFMLSAIAHGRTRVVNPNAGDDVIATIRALRQLGVEVRHAGDDYVVVGRDALRDPSSTIDCGNSGTTMRLLMGILAGRVDALLDGDASLRRRPMARVADPLKAMGAKISMRPRGLPPVRLHRQTARLRSTRFTMRVASAQVKSAVLLAALRAEGTSVITTPAVTRDHTERLLRAMGAKLRVNGRAIRVVPSSLKSIDVLRIPGDVSSAVYLLCAAAAIPGSHLRLRDIGINPTRSAALDILRRMGTRIKISARKRWSGEPVADISISGGARLRGVTIPVQMVPNLIDEIPALCALATIARGTLMVRGAAELRVKESNRIRTTVELLRSFGADARSLADGIVVRGGRALRAPRSVSTHGDHRIGLSAAVLAAAARAPITIRDVDCIATSFPNFAETWNAAFTKKRT
jgi:3-phosphoshikimate 1-carboxyvinyltransferase